MPADNHLIVFTRFPRAGHTKTRLIPALGAEKAAELQQKMTEKIGEQALKLKRERGIPVTFFFTDATEKTMAAWLGKSFDYHHQCSGDIGCRMADAFTQIFKHTSESAVLIGSDVPELTTEILAEAFTLLKTVDSVIGPSVDGGYYLIGLRTEYAEQLINALFNGGIPWSTGKVLELSIQRLSDCGRRYTLLQTLRDVDRPEDLHAAEKVHILCHR